MPSKQISYDSHIFLKLFYSFMIGLLFMPFANAEKPLDIRPYEAADPCEPDNAQVRVTVTGVGSGGILSVELYHDENNFLNKKGRTKRIRIPASEGQHTVCFDLEKQGTYAVAAYHDNNYYRLNCNRYGASFHSQQPNFLL